MMQAPMLSETSKPRKLARQFLLVVDLESIGMGPLGRTAVVAVVLAILESAWAYYSGANQDSIGLSVYYGVAVAALVVFFIPGLVELDAKPAGKTNG
jgi:hypothetical protein